MPTPKAKSPQSPKPKSPKPKSPSAKNKPHLTSAEMKRYNSKVMEGRAERGVPFKGGSRSKSRKRGGSRKRRS
jgi:hypothetical protein